jgi:glycosyltransferase involved in cell wall biosynthesis
MIETTVIIATIGRETLSNAIESALNEDFKVIVVGDGIEINDKVKNAFPEVIFSKTGKKYGSYGWIASNVASFMANTEFVTTLDDDDEIIAGKGKFIKEKINSDPTVDIWIPGIVYNNGISVCVNKRTVEAGNVTHPTIKTDVVAFCPRRHVEKSEWEHENLLDFFYINEVVKKGFKIDWIGEEIIAIRPKLKGTHGQGLETVET